MVIVAWSFHSDAMKLAAMGLVVITFFGWYFPFLKFCERHPADALLDGEHWMEHQRHQAAAKGYTPPTDQSPTSLPTGSQTVMIGKFSAVPDEENSPHA